MRLSIHQMLKLGTTKSTHPPPGSASASANQSRTEDMAAPADKPGFIKSTKCSQLSSKLQTISSTAANAIKRASRKIRSVLHKSTQKGSTTHGYTSEDDAQQYTDSNMDLLFDSYSSVSDSHVDLITCGPLPAHDPGYTLSPHLETDTSMEVCEWASSPDISADIYAIRAAAADDAQSDHVLHRASCLKRADDQLYHVPGRLNIRFPEGATGSMRLPSDYPRGAKGLKRPGDCDFPSWYQGPDGYMVPTPRLLQGIFLPKPSRLREVHTIEYAECEEIRSLSQMVSPRSVRRTKAMHARQCPAPKRSAEPIRLVADEEQTSTSPADSSTFDGNWVAYGNDSEEEVDVRPPPLSRAMNPLPRSKGGLNLHSVRDDIILEEDSEEEHAVAESLSEVNWKVVGCDSFTSLAEEPQDFYDKDSAVNKQAPVCSTQRVKADSINILRPFSALYAIVTGKDTGSDENVAALDHFGARISSIQVKAFDGEDSSECDASSVSILSQELERDVTEISAATSLSEQYTPTHHEAQSGPSRFLGGVGAKLQEQLADILSAIDEDFDHDDNEIILPCSLPALPTGVRYADERTPIISSGPHLIIPEDHARITFVTGDAEDE